MKNLGYARESDGFGNKPGIAPGTQHAGNHSFLAALIAALYYCCLNRFNRFREHSTLIKRRIGQILCLITVLTVATAASPQATQVVVIDSSAPAHPFPHFWEQMFGSGRAVLSLRDSYRRDLREVKQVTDLRYVRFHAVFHDEMGIYDEDQQGHPTYNFS